MVQAVVITTTAIIPPKTNPPVFNSVLDLSLSSSTLGAGVLSGTPMLGMRFLETSPLGREIGVEKDAIAGLTTPEDWLALVIEVISIQRMQ